MSNKTIVYYSSNREPWETEKKVIETIKENSNGLPVISVTQKPIDFGKNICIGEKISNYHNCYRQLLLACMMAETEYVISCEADCLYPPEYFQYEPDGKHDLYRYMNIWILAIYDNKYRKKRFTEGGQISNRKYLIDRIDERMSDLPMWDSDNKISKIYKHAVFGEFTGETPIISLKTGHGVNLKTGTLKDRTYELPHWGNSNEVKKMMHLI